MLGLSQTALATSSRLAVVVGWVSSSASSGSAIPSVNAAVQLEPAIGSDLEAGLHSLLELDPQPDLIAEPDSPLTGILLPVVSCPTAWLTPTLVPAGPQPVPQPQLLARPDLGLLAAPAGGATPQLSPESSSATRGGRRLDTPSNADTRLGKLTKEDAAKPAFCTV